MDGLMYPLSLVIIAVMAFSFNRSNNNFLALILLVAGAYIIYSHETGITVTDYKNQMVESVDSAAGNTEKWKDIKK